MHPHQSDGTLAQMVEQWTENPCVPGSIPGGTTNTKSKPLKSLDVQGFYFFSSQIWSQKLKLFITLMICLCVPTYFYLNIHYNFIKKDFATRKFIHC